MMAAATTGLRELTNMLTLKLGVNSEACDREDDRKLSRQQRPDNPDAP